MINYITGERLQSIANCTVMFFLNDIIKEQLKRFTMPVFKFNENENIKNIPISILEAKIIFIYTHDIPVFFEKIVPNINNSIVLITHNSDLSVNQSHIKYINNEKIKKWYALNTEITHPKLTPLPIGIANSQWSHGNLNLIDTIRNENSGKQILCYKNFDLNTNSSIRQLIAGQTFCNDIVMHPRKSHIEHLKDISCSYFNICPPGNGIDTHRTWESLYLGSIPILLDCPHNRSFKDLPIILTDNYLKITKDFLCEKLPEMQSQKYNLEKLDLEYWRKQIKESL